MWYCRKNKAKTERYTKIINIPVIVKFVFQRLTAENPHAVYANINLQATAPKEIEDRSILISADIGDVIRKMSQ